MLDMLIHLVPLLVFVRHLKKKLIILFDFFLNFIDVVLCFTVVLFKCCFLCVTDVILCLTDVILCVTDVILCLTDVILCLTGVILCLTGVILCH
jgi:hypothetical protein